MKRHGLAILLASTGCIESGLSGLDRPDGPNRPNRPNGPNGPSGPEDMEQPNGPPPCPTDLLRLRSLSRTPLIVSQGEAQAWDVDVRGDRAYVTGKQGLQVFDIQDPSAPIWLGAQETPLPLARGLALSEDVAFMAVIGDGVRVLSLEEPQPREIGAYDLVGSAGAEYANDLQLVEDRLFVAALAQGLWILDVSQPASPRPVSSCCTTREHPLQGLSDVHVRQGIAYVTDTEQQLRLLDTENGLRQLGSAPLPAPGRALWGDSVYTYVAADEAGLVVFDVQDPTAPVELARAQTSGPAIELKYESTRSWLHVASLEGGLEVFDISDPSEPRLHQQVETEGDVRAIDTGVGNYDGNYIYVADGDALLVLEWRCEG